jgi:hypothetical protein
MRVSIARNAAHRAERKRAECFPGPLVVVEPPSLGLGAGITASLAAFA